MSVYFIAAPDFGLVKIGFAERPWSRLGKAQVDSPTRLILLATIDGGKAEERKLHARFADLRARGEWFRHEGQLADFIASLEPYAKAPREVVVKAIAASAGISQSYASFIYSGVRIPSVSLAIHIFRTANWLHPRLVGMTELEMQTFEKYDRWSSQMAKSA